MIECSVRELTKFYGSNKVFENISFEIHQGDRIGLIGQNGCGKTTLLEVLTGKEEYQSGTISIRKGAKIGYLEQLHKTLENATVKEVLWQAFSEITDLKKLMDDLEKSFIGLSEDDLSSAMSKYGHYMEEYERRGAYGIETEFNKVCEGLDIDEALLDMDFEDLSGGEKTRVVLGKLLMESPDILFLDEPSNHLDIDTIQWLENYLLEYKGSVLIISHDRYFLDRVANKIYELDSESVASYGGNYSRYVIEREKRFLEDFRRYQNQQKELDRVKKQIHRYRVWGAMRDSETMYKRAKELEKRLEKVDILDRPVLEKRRIRIDSTSGSRSGKIVLAAESISKSFGDKKLMADIDVKIFYQDSVCLMGANGSGKTTLLKMVTGDIVPDSGKIRIGDSVKIGYLPQNIVFENEEETILEYFSGRHNINFGEARSILAKMLFMQEDVNKQIKNLSGGEKSRLKLCSLTYEKVNFLILDEPTNHLDIESREELEESLISFDGTLFFVSHDRYFVQKVADKILWLEKCGLEEFPFGYDDFLEKRKKLELLSVKDISKKEPKKEKREKKREKAPAKKIDPADIEKQIEMLEEKKNEIVDSIEKNQSDYVALTALLSDKEALDKELKNLYSQWESLL